MIVRDAYGHDVEVPDAFDQDFEIEITPENPNAKKGSTKARPFLHPWTNRSNPASRAAAFALTAAKEHQKGLIQSGLERHGIRRDLPLTIVLTRVAHRGVLDDDGVPGAMKYVRDQIARWLGLNSDRKPGLRFLYGQQKTSRPGFLGVRITIINNT